MDAPKNEEAVSSSKAGGRGISYPSLTLEEAITRAQQFYNHEKKGAAPLAAVAQHWGYSVKSSGLRLVAAALLHYGLMEDSGSNDARMLKLSARALDILLDEPNSPNRLKAIQAAAQSPKIIAEILAKWPANSLPSDATLRFWLIRDRNFKDEAADGFIKDFRSTIAYAKLGDSANIPAQVGEKSAEKPVSPKVGDYVQWESGGVLQFATPRKVTGIADAGDYVFVEGSQTGVPMSEVAVVALPVGVAPPPATGAPPPIAPPAAGTRQDVWTIDEGQVVLQWPSKMSAASFEDFEAWIALQLKKIKRGIEQ